MVKYFKLENYQKSGYQLFGPNVNFLCNENYSLTLPVPNRGLSLSYSLESFYSSGFYFIFSRILDLKYILLFAIPFEIFLS